MLVGDLLLVVLIGSSWGFAMFLLGLEEMDFIDFVFGLVARGFEVVCVSCFVWKV